MKKPRTTMRLPTAGMKRARAAWKKMKLSDLDSPEERLGAIIKQMRVHRLSLEFAKAAFDIAKAVFEELEFSYSHPGAAMRGEVWTSAVKCPVLYRAYKRYAEIIEKAEK